MEAMTKTFDAVEESRKWQEVISRKLDAMSPDQRVTYLSQVGERYATERAARRMRRNLVSSSS